jgi:hypothetical protein
MFRNHSGGKKIRKRNLSAIITKIRVIFNGTIVTFVEQKIGLWLNQKKRKYTLQTSLTVF